MDGEPLSLAGDIAGLVEMRARIGMILAMQLTIFITVPRLMLLRVTSKTIHRVRGGFFRGLLDRFLLFIGLKG